MFNWLAEFPEASTVVYAIRRLLNQSFCRCCIRDHLMGPILEGANLMQIYPKCSKHGIFTYIYHLFSPNVGVFPQKNDAGFALVSIQLTPA